MMAHLLGAQRQNHAYKPVPSADDSVDQLRTVVKHELGSGWCRKAVIWPVSLIISFGLILLYL